MFKLSRQQKDHRYFCGNRYEKYSIKKLKVGAASVLIGAGFLFLLQCRYGRSSFYY